MQAATFEYLKSNPNIEVLITKDDKEAQIASHCALFLGYESFVLPDFRASYGDDLRSYKEELFEINISLGAYFETKKSKKVLISPFRTLAHSLPKESLFQNFKLCFGQSLKLE